MPPRSYQDLLESFRQNWQQYVLDNLEQPWDWGGLSSNNYVTERMILDHPELPWKEVNFIFNDSLSWKYFDRWLQSLQHQNDDSNLDSRFIYEYLSEHPDATIENVLKDPNHPWEKSSLLMNPSMNLSKINKYFLEGDFLSVGEKRWVYHCVSGCDYISLDYILQHPYYNWDWNIIISRPDVTLSMFTEMLPIILARTLDDIEYNPINSDDPSQDVLMDWTQISKNPNLTYEYVQQNSNFPWDWIELSRHPNISVNIILDNVHEQWNWKYVSYNPTLVWKQVVDNPDLTWNWVAISAHLNITWETISQHQGYPWDWQWVSANRNIGWDQVHSNLDKNWNYRFLSANPMPRYQERWIDKTRLEWIASRRIHRFWRDVTCNPVYKLARRRLHELCVSST